MDVIEKIKHEESFGFDETFDIYRLCANAITENEPSGRDLLIHILDSIKKFDPRLHNVLADLVEAIGFYPYLEKEGLILTSVGSQMRMAANLSNHVSSRVFHDEQKRLLDLIRSDVNIVVSAPTSFGKSILIEEIIASRKYRNIAIIQPTLALLDETRRRLAKYTQYYKLILRTSQVASEVKGNIFLLTSERINEYPHFPKIDFLIVDEFYKLSANRDDERSDSLNNAFLYLVSKFDCKFYLLGPNIDGVSDGFLRKYGAIFFKTEYSLVACDEHNIYELHEGRFGQKGQKKLNKELALFDLLKEFNGQQTLVYCASPGRARYLARQYTNYLQSKGVSPANDELSIIPWIRDNVSPQWSLIDFLKFSIGIHDGALQRHITSTIIEYFDIGIINVLFCTTTIIEGVNTNAKNIVYFDQIKGRNTKIDYFDYANIRGRAGRLMEHYIGNVYNFGAPPVKDKIYIDVPFVDQMPISDEVLINIDRPDVLDKDALQYKYIEGLSAVERELFAANGINIKGQSNLLSRLRDDFADNYELLCWDALPTYKQLTYCLTLAWECLVKPGESFGSMTVKRIVNLTFNYGLHQSINKIVGENFSYNRGLTKNVEKTDAALMDEAIRESFQILRHWFQYKIPKWILVVDRLQKFVCDENGRRAGSYLYYAAFLENDFLRENLSILAEYGMPRSAIAKLAKYIDGNLDQDAVIAEISRRGLHDISGLTKYEREKVVSNFVHIERGS